MKISEKVLLWQAYALGVCGEICLVDPGQLEELCFVLNAEFETHITRVLQQFTIMIAPLAF